MKRIIILSLCIILCLFAACGGNEAVKNAEKAIDKIGIVTLDSEEDIIAAEKAYDKLSADEKKEVGNYFLLQDAREEFDLLKLIDDNTIKNYENLDASGANLFTDVSVKEWFEDDDASATLGIALLIKGMEDNQVDFNKYVMGKQYICINEAEGRIDIYAPYNSGEIMGIRYWKSKKKAEIGTVTTDFSSEEYAEFLKENGIIDDYKLIGISNIQRILNVMQS